MRTRSRFYSPSLIVAITAWLMTGCTLTPERNAPSAVSDNAPSAPADHQTGQGQATPAVADVSIAPSRLIGRSPVFQTAPLPELNLVNRLRDGFALPVSADETVQAELVWYASHPDYIERVFGRAGRYLFYIAEELEARGMPSDLALLPIVESAFDPFAYSRGRASGLWQIIPGTGDWLGLKQNWWYDGRRDVIDSTRAALDYLEHLHETFEGDWLLAVAGYNSGEGHVARALEKARREGRSTDFWGVQQDLRQETASYVPKLLAIRDLVADPKTHGVAIPAIANHAYFDTIETEGQIDIAMLAEIGDLSVDTLYELNPGINRWATDPDGPHRIVVPLEHAAAVRDAIGALSGTELVRWTRHAIRPGETLSEIAERYQTTAAVLREVNSIAGNLIRAGDHLMVPHASAIAASYGLSLESRTLAQQQRERDGHRIDYRVQAGDSLWSIASRHGVATSALASWNAMAPGDVLSVGRDLVIWTDDPVAVALATIGGPAAIRRVNYVVRSGDSLAAIASRFRVGLDELIEWNSIEPERYLQPGQTLVLYVDVTEQST